MAQWLAPHKQIGGLFLVNTDNRRRPFIKRMEGIPFTVETGRYGTDWEARWNHDLREMWMRPNFWSDWWAQMETEFPAASLGEKIAVFEFKDKQFVKLGTVDGLTKIRAITNLTDDFRDRIPQYKELETNGNLAGTA